MVPEALRAEDVGYTLHCDGLPPFDGLFEGELWLAQLDAKAIADNVILRGIIKGDFSELTPHLFADALVAGNPVKVKQAMAQILKGSPDEIAAVRQEYVSQFFARYSGGAQLDSTGAGIWNPQRLAADLAGKNGKTLRANMEAVLGKKQASEIIAANQVLDAGSALRKSTAPKT